jgi:RNA polymerase sigma-70 factor, ECF subfamily
LSVIEASDVALVVGIGRFQQHALEEAYRRHGGAALRLARRIVGSEQMAEEIVQEVFVQLWRTPETFDPARGNLQSFVLMKTHGRAVDLLRSDAARRGREETDHRRSVAVGQDVEREVLDLTIADRLDAALANLSEDERKAISLAYYGGHTYREVSVILGQPEGTVKSRIRTGLKTLRRSVSDLEDHLHDRPAHDRSGHDRPAQDRPAQDRPAQDRPGHDRPAPAKGDER